MKEKSYTTEATQNWDEIN